MGVDSRLGLSDTLPFGQYKGKTVEVIYKEDAGYLMWLRDKKAEGGVNPKTDKANPPNREFFDVEVLTLLNSTISADRGRYRKHKVWDDVGKLPEPDDTPFPSDDLYNQWGAF